MVDSGTRKAAAISRVVRPPTARNVSGMADAGVSDGWQHMNISVRVSSSPGAGSGRGSDQEAAGSSRRRRASSRRNCSIIRREATRMSQASGLSGRWSTWSSHLGVWRAQHLADLDGLAHGYSIGPWSCRGLRGDLDGSFERLDIDQSVTGKQFLGFRERAVGDHRCAGPTRHNEPGLVGTGQTLGVDQLAAL
jgi:hypothetical protein